MDFKKKPSTDFKPVAALDKDEAEKQIEALREGIDYHDYRYYVKNDPVISDAVYDKLFKRLRELEDAYPEFQSGNSPTRRVGAEPVDELKKVEHSTVMLSLNASLEKKEVRDFFDFVARNTNRKDVEFVLEPKFDRSGPMENPLGNAAPDGPMGPENQFPQPTLSETFRSGGFPQPPR
jgi:DNA ligase (NAD+)